LIGVDSSLWGSEKENTAFISLGIAASVLKWPETSWLQAQEALFWLILAGVVCSIGLGA
jgi:hypothetical protein